MSAVGRFLRRFAIALLFVLAAASGTVAGVLVVYTSDLPQISALDDYAPSTITRVYAAGGEVVGEFATQRRIVITYDQIPPVMRQAIMAAEDAEFDSHMGLSITRIIVTLARDLLENKRAGASTLTQQLTRKLFLNDDKTWERKIKEAVLAIQIEKRYTKPEIVTLYCNQIPWGHGTYGVEAAARLYFGKAAKDVTLEEAALLAGIIQAPARHSPYVNLHQRHAPAQLRARPDGRRRLHHPRARRAGEEGADRHRRPARRSTPTPPSSSRRCGSSSRSATAPSSSTRTAWPSTRRST